MPLWISNEAMDRLILWQNPRDSGIIFGLGLVVLVAVRYVSLLSVIGNLFLALITAAMAFRIYKSVLAAVNKSSNDSHPFKSFLDADINLGTDKVQSSINWITETINKILNYLRKTFLIDNMVESIKFGVMMYVLIVLGRWLNGLTLVTLMWVFHFTAPKIYLDNKKTIDDALQPAKLKYEELMDKLKASMPAAFADAKKTE